MKRSRPKPFSAKRLAQRDARRDAVAAVIARDRGCMFERLVAEHAHELSEADRIELGKAGPCRGPLTMQEMAHRRNVDPTNPDDGLCSCWGHNGFAEDHPRVCQLIGFSIRGNGLPLNNVHPSEAAS